MTLSIGIVGLPNVGKSTLFNAITNSSVEAQNYPFCTIEPNVGIVKVPDERLHKIAEICHSERVLESVIEFVDIAGLVKGASKGEGLGNKFLENIRQTSAIAHVIRCFDDPNVIHVHGKVDPESDAEVIQLELILSDLENVQKWIQNAERKTKTGNKDEMAKLAALQKVKETLEAEKPIRAMELSNDEKTVIKEYPFITQKPMIYVANVAESDLKIETPAVQAVRKVAAKTRDEVVIISSKIEAELAELSPEDRVEFLKELGIAESGLDQLAKAGFRLLGLQTYLTVGPKEARSWTIQKGDAAPKAAGVIHTDFEKGFIRANVINWELFLECGGWKGAKDKGKVRQEGKTYVMQEGDIVEFLFNV